MTTLPAFWATLSLPMLPVAAFLCAWGYDSRRRKRHLNRALAYPNEVTRAWVEGPDSDGYSRLYACFLDGKKVLLANDAGLAAAKVALAAVGLVVAGPV